MRMLQCWMQNWCIMAVVPVVLPVAADEVMPDMMSQMLPVLSIAPCCSFACCPEVSEVTAVEGEV